MWVQFISPHSLDYWIHYFPTKFHSLWPMNSNWTSNEITWHTRTHFSYWGGTLMCTHPFNNCNCDMLTCCRRGAWSQFGIFRSRWVWFVGIGANGRLGYPLVVHWLPLFALWGLNTTWWCDPWTVLAEDSSSLISCILTLLERDEEATPKFSV